MARELEEIPIFPLNTVVFPNATIQLHIFEPRYREMVQTCLAKDQPFGIVLIRSGHETDQEVEPYLVGTLVRIMKVLHTYDDGRMDIQVIGERRFRIRRLVDSRTYLTGFVEPVVESPLEDDGEGLALLQNAKQEFEVLVQRLFDRSEFSVHVVFPPDPAALSFTIANLLQIENLQKQHLLEMTDTIERVRTLLPILETHLMDVRTPPFVKLQADDLREYINPN